MTPSFLGRKLCRAVQMRRMIAIARTSHHDIMPASEHRKQQNRLANKRYRERQKQRLRALENAAHTSYSYVVVSGAASAQPGISISESSGQPGRAASETELVVDNSNGEESSLRNSPRLQPYFHQNVPIASPRQNQHALPGITALDQDISLISSQSNDWISLELDRNILGTISAETANQEGKPDRPQRVPQTTVSNDNNTLTVHPSYMALIGNSLDLFGNQNFLQDRLSEQNSNPGTATSTSLDMARRSSGTGLPSPYVNTLTLEIMTLLGALDVIKMQLAVTDEMFCAPDAESPFHRPQFLTSGSCDRMILACQNTFASVKRDLRPTRTQILTRHHPWIDVIPFPDLRDVVIAFQSHEPPLINEDDFFHDIIEGGMICWGSISQHGSGAPWDKRSWEARTWFLNKWKIVFEKADDCVDQSRWWREMRGDPVEV